MATRYPHPESWVALPDADGGIEPLDYKKYGHLDIDPDDDEEPEIFPPEVAAILGFDPMAEHQVTGDENIEETSATPIAPLGSGGV